jgi:hypothetical protein
MKRSERTRTWLAALWLVIPPSILGAFIASEFGGLEAVLSVLAWLAWCLGLYRTMGWMTFGDKPVTQSPAKSDVESTRRLWFPTRAQWFVIWTVTVLALLIWWLDPSGNEFRKGIISVLIIGALFIWRLSRRGPARE